MERYIPRRSKETAINQLLNKPSQQIESISLFVPRGDLSDDSDMELEEEEVEEEDSDNDSANIVINERLDDTQNETSDDVHTYRWRRRSNGLFPTRFSCAQSESIERPDSPYLRFKEYFPDEIFQFIAEQTNIYSVEKSGVSVNTNALEVEQLFAIWIYMGIFSAPSYRDYWSPLTKWPCIADIMSVNRYEKLMQFFHLYET